MLLTCGQVTKYFGDNKVIENISFTLDEKEKAALIGVNGAGKTTLLKIITGELLPDDGFISSSTSIGYLEQMADSCPENTIYEEMLTVFNDLIEMENALRDMEQQMAGLSGIELERTMERYGRLSHEFEDRKGYEYKSRIRGVIKGLGFSDEESNQPLSELSGGQKTRVSLGKLLLKNPELLLLDEPTNHLDITSIEWLEDFLRNYQGAILLVSHDRYFTDRVATKIIELENAKSTVYNGNYTYYANKKTADREIHLKHYINQQKEIRRQEEVIRTLRSYNREKSIKRAESREKMLEKMERVEKPDNEPDKMRITLKPKRESGNDVLYLEDVTKSFNELLFKNVGFDIKKGEKAALIGPNGIGKTTLLRIILNKLPCDSGIIRLGANVHIGFYDQEQQELNSELSIFDEISECFPKLTAGEIRNTLAAFVFTGDDVFKKIDYLSGGERGRVALAKIMLAGANFLILDEPTNHLDIYSKEILEDALRRFTGTVLYVSHDRYFINNTANKIIEMTEEGVHIYWGNYDYYMEKKLERRQEETDSSRASANPKNEHLRKKEQESEQRRKNTLLQKTQKEIEAAEKELEELDGKLFLPEVGTDPELSHQLYTKKQELEALLYKLYEIIL